MQQLILKDLNGTPVYILPPFSPKLQNVYGGTYLKEQGIWIFPAFHPFQKFVESDLQKLFGPEIVLSEAAETHSKEQATYPDKISKQIWNPSFEFITKPYDHQKEAFAFGLYNIRAGLFLDLGLGKSKISVDLVRYLGETTLVVAPRVLLYKWADEIHLHSGGQLKPVVIDGTPEQKLKCIQAPGDIYIATYGTASGFAQQILDQIPYKICIIDESHNLQSPSTEKTKAAVFLSRKAYRRILLSGTASLGDPRHLYGQLDFLGPFLHEENFWKFCSKYVRYQDKRHHIVLGYRNLDVLQRRLNIVGIRKTKEECLDLPEQTFVEIPYPLSSEQRVAYNELVTGEIQDVGRILRLSDEAVAPVRINKLAQILSGFQIQSNKDPFICNGCSFLAHCVEQDIKPYTAKCEVIKIPPAPTKIVYKDNPKLNILKELLEVQLAEPTNKTIIWAHYLDELDLIEKSLNVGYVRLDGSVSAKSAKERIERFQTDPDCRVFLGQIASGVGIDLTAANYMIYFSLDFDLGHYLQSLGRAHRIGQTRNVTVYVLLHKGSIDTAIFSALQNKEDIRLALTNPKYNGPSAFLRLIARPVAI